MLPPAAKIHFQNLWGDTVVGTAMGLNQQVAAFDEHEGAQRGSQGYRARLDNLIAAHMKLCGQKLLGVLLQVHQAFGSPQDRDAEESLLQWGQAACDSLKARALGIANRHPTRVARTNTHPEHRAIDLAAPLVVVHVLNNVRRHFWTLRNVPGANVDNSCAASILLAAQALMIDTNDTSKPGLIDEPLHSFETLVARIDRQKASLQNRVPAGFSQSYYASDGSLQKMSMKGVKSPHQLQDELLSQFIWMWSLKDHFKDAYRSKGWDDKEIETLVNSSPSLQFAADIANKEKHAVLNKSRSGEWAELVGIGVDVPRSALEKIVVGLNTVDIHVAKVEETTPRAVVRLRSGVEIDAFEVLEKAMAAWKAGPIAKLQSK